MDHFEKEQHEILKLSDIYRDDRNVNKREKHRQYVSIVKDFLERHVPSDFQLVEHSYIEGFEKKFHLIMIKKGAKSISCKKIPCYGLKSIAAVIEIRGSGLVNKKHKLKEDVKTKKSRFEKIKERDKNIKCLYLTLQEREKTVKGTNYVQLSQQYLKKNFFYLRESTTHETIPGEWERFVRTLLDL